MHLAGRREKTLTITYQADSAMDVDKYMRELARDIHKLATQKGRQRRNHVRIGGVKVE